MHMPARIVLGILVLMSGVALTGTPGGKDSTASMEDFRPGDTLRFTTDGSTPDRTSRFVLFGSNEVLVTRTTIFKARLYRPGYLPSEVQSCTVYVRDSTQSASLDRKSNSPGVSQAWPHR
jgi:hypothetical protein